MIIILKIHIENSCEFNIFSQEVSIFKRVKGDSLGGKVEMNWLSIKCVFRRANWPNVCCYK